MGVPPADAVRDLVQLPDGEIRHYGYLGDKESPELIYLSSRDHGLSWQEFAMPERCPGAAVRSPWSGDWLTVTEVPTGQVGGSRALSDQCPAMGTYVHRSTSGIDGPFESSLISDIAYGSPRQPFALRNRQRWIVPCHIHHSVSPDRLSHPVVLLSDDDGRTWRRTLLDTVGPHRVEWPHEGVRWQNYACLPTVVELTDGRLWMLVRTSQDNLYESHSDDAGETWSSPCPSAFYGTLTLAALFRMHDGRVLLFWCNTTPLPEVDHATQPELTESARSGRSEDVFTNRDVLHAAISEDDCQTWIGFREIALNERRNDADFRSSGGNRVTRDKSVHQAQAVELPAGKVLVSLGQHPLCRRLVIFDPAWLYETDRRDDFAAGLGGWSIHQYVRSLAGGFRGITGHCAYNRRPGPQLIPDPDGEPREVLQIARHPDPRLLHERQGAVWNFPAGRAGSVRLRIRLPQGGQGARICLLDRWFNPVDPVVHHFAQYVLGVDADGRINDSPELDHDCWQDLEIRWTDSANGCAEFRVGESGGWTPMPLTRPSTIGISYLHLQSTAESPDPQGLLLSEISASVRGPES